MNTENNDQLPVTNDQYEERAPEAPNSPFVNRHSSFVNAAVRLLTGWGVPGSVARILAGAIIGAVAAYVTLTQSSCTATYNQTADGVNFAGAIVLPTTK